MGSSSWAFEQIEMYTSINYICGQCAWLMQVTLMCVQHYIHNMQDGQTPFLRAAAMNHVEVANFLLENGSSILERAIVSNYKHTKAGTSRFSQYPLTSSASYQLTVQLTVHMKVWGSKYYALNNTFCFFQFTFSSKKLPSIWLLGEGTWTWSNFLFHCLELGCTRRTSFV